MSSFFDNSLLFLIFEKKRLRELWSLISRVSLPNRILLSTTMPAARANEASEESAHNERKGEEEEEEEEEEQEQQEQEQREQQEQGKGGGAERILDSKIESFKQRSQALQQGTQSDAEMTDAELTLKYKAELASEEGVCPCSGK